MGTEQNENYYDTHLPAKIIPGSWIALYWTVFGLVAPFIFNHPRLRYKLAELGCGPGAFARLLQSAAFDNYLGIDFSRRCLEIAKKGIPKPNNLKFNKYNLVTNHKSLKPLLKNYDIFVSIEVLEHIIDDFKVLELIPKDKIVVLTGPNTNDYSHVRWFDTLGKFMKRYSNFIDYDFISELSAGRGKKFYIVRGIKK